MTPKNFWHGILIVVLSGYCFAGSGAVRPHWPQYRHDRGRNCRSGRCFGSRDCRSDSLFVQEPRHFGLRRLDRERVESGQRERQEDLRAFR